MEIDTLRIVFTEEDLNDITRKVLLEGQPVEDVVIRVSPEGFRVTGSYPLFITVRFEMLWQIRVENEWIVLTLDRFKAMGVPASIFKSAVLKFFEDVASKEPGIAIDEDSIRVQPDRLIEKYACRARTHLKAIQCLDGVVAIEASRQ